VETAASSPRVFVSYAHESEEHRRAVLSLAQQLRRAGVDCWLDQFDEIPPPTSWPQWMYRQLSEADVVLVVCTESYRRRVEGREAAGVGFGARWEGAIITQELYEQPPGARVKYIPVLLSRQDVRHIPYFLRSTTHHVVTAAEPGTYLGLLRQLSGHPTAVPEPLGTGAAPRGQGDKELPAAVSLLDLLGRDPIAPDRLRDRWRTPRGHPGSPAAVIGVGGDGVVGFDPATEGPHCLVVGAPGAGKTTLLRTLVASLALRHPPDAWGFVLIDYKGGAAFGDLVALPHTVGVVTDLDRWTSRRLLKLLRAEARRRERALAAAGADNFGWLGVRSAGAAEPAIPRLLVVVDEFASLVTELPDTITGLLDIAMRGRSLGIHLVLSPQRAAGAVTAAMRASISTRICLRVAHEEDSLAVLDSPAGADLPRSVPGRALKSVAGQPPRLFQVARLGDGDAGGRSTVEVVQVVATAAGQDARSRWRRWPSPLPTRLVLDDGRTTASPSDGFGAVVGLADVPDLLEQHPWSIQLDRSGAVVAVGTRGSGRTTWLTTVGRSLAARHGAGWDLYAASLDGELTGLAQLPQCQLAIRSDPALARDMVLLAAAELTTRTIGARLLAAGDDREAQATGAGDRRQGRRLVVAVDRLDLLLQGNNADELFGAVQRLAVDGPGAGVHLLATTDVAGARKRSLAEQFPHRLLLRLGDKRDYAQFDVAASDTPEQQPPGRGLWLPEGVEVQVAKAADC
jgi:DNA segregation ATPase FtsK/SpoIIIE, S-DNA-T family